MIVGNKCDLEDQREVCKVEGQDIAKLFGCPFFETSALSRINIGTFFILRKNKKDFKQK